MALNEMYGGAVTCVTSIAEILIAGYCLYWLAKPFIENKKRAFLTGTAYSFILLIIYIAPLYVDYFAAYSIAVLAAFLAMCRTDRRNFEQKIFITVTFFALRLLASAMAEILYDHLYSFAENTGYMAAHGNMDLALYVGVCTVYLGLEFLFTMIGVWCIVKAYAYRHADMGGKELLMLSLPSAAGVIGHEIMRHYRIFYALENGRNTKAYDALAVVYYAASIITIVVVIVLYQSVKAAQEERLQNELLAAQVDSIRQHIEQVESLYQNIRGIRHDMANHIVTLERLYAGNQAEEAKAYSTGLKTALAETAGEIKSGNPVTDVILQELKNKAEKRGIRFHSDFHYPAASNVNAFDISVILNNALQNAVENAGRDGTPHISILSYRRNNAYMIEVSNSFTGSLQWDAERGLPVTSKEKIGTHGYGLANIRRVAGKYAGDCVIDVEDGEFRLSVMLMLEPAAPQ